MLQADTIFIAAISANAGLMETLGNRVYDTTAAVPDEQLRNLPVPYVMVTYDGMTNGTATKDDFDFEAEEDTETVSIDITATTREQLATIAATVRKTVREYIADDANDTGVLDYQISGSAVNYDSLKPCYWQTLTYQVQTPNDK